MYTRCPHCKTIFEVTAEQLRRAQGDVDCVACDETFDAVETLADDVTLLIGAEELSADDLTTDENFAGDDTTVVDEDLAAEDFAEEDTVTREKADEKEPDTAEDDEPESEQDAADAEAASADDEEPADHDVADEAPEETAAEEEPADDSADEAAVIAYDDESELPDETDQESDEAPGETAAEEEPADDSADEAAVIAYDDESELPDEIDQEPDEAPADTDRGSNEDRFDAVLFAAGRTAEELSDPGQTDADDLSADELEFNAPEQTWTRYFLTDGENVAPNRERNDQAAQQQAESEPWIGPDEDADDRADLEFATADPDEWQSLLEELNGGDAQSPGPAEAQPESDSEREYFSSLDDEFDAYEDATDGQDDVAAPPWFEDDTPEPARTAVENRYLYAGLGLCLVLLLTLIGQLIHYNRDRLAGDPVYGTPVRGIYAAFGATLYPDWPLDVFEVTGTEAIAGRTSAGTLDVLANVIVGGDQPVGLPSIRIVLNDRWGTPLASRVFSPAEYLRTYDPDQPLVQPGAALPVEVSVADPGTDALGYVVDVCLPRRKSGLECQISRDPFK